MLLRWDAWKRYPVMSVYLTGQGVAGVACLLIAYFGAAMPYFYTYYVVTILADLIAFAVALELYYKIFDPKIGLFVWQRRHAVIIISVSLAVAITLGRLFAARNGGSLTRTMVTVDEVMSVALWATFCALWIYSRLWDSFGARESQELPWGSFFILPLQLSVFSSRPACLLVLRSLPTRLG